MNISLSKQQKLYIVAAAVLLIFLILGLSFLFQSGKKSKLSPSLPSVTVGSAAFGPVARYIDAIGTLRPFDSVVIKSEVNSKVDKIHFSEGATVRKDDLLIELDDSVAKAQLMEAEALYRRSKSEFDPIEKLADRGVAARVQKETKRAEMDKCAASVNSQRTLVEKHKIHAPFGGTVGLKEISRGQFVSPGAELVKIVDCHPLKVDFKVTEVDIGNIYVGQEIKIMVGGDKTQEFAAKITAIDPESDRISHSFNVRAILDVPEEVAINSQILKPGRFVSVKIPIDGNQRGIVIPESALEKIGDEYTVFRLADGVAIRTLVTVGVRRDGNAEIITGLNEGDLVIISGQSGVLDGRGVSVKNEALFPEIKGTRRQSAAEENK
ncbi:MAG: efflux RND transporter periplasmic adaptor subunit [Holosporaceae bacterium]|jgi:membrane fusion protein (multidrug efflux system)|nr:efflux RND transporter periplasmic adaptor subunit [Holosporaceae bacterium]